MGKIRPTNFQQKISSEKAGECFKFQDPDFASKNYPRQSYDWDIPLRAKSIRKNFPNLEVDGSVPVPSASPVIRVVLHLQRHLGKEFWEAV